jgi:hypothetical protein
MYVSTAVEFVAATLKVGELPCLFILASCHEHHRPASRAIFERFCSVQFFGCCVPREGKEWPVDNHLELIGKLFRRTKGEYKTASF